MTSVLFVCLGNICRSPAAEGVFTALVEQAGLEEKIRIDSAGTGDWHVGHAPDPRMIEAAAGRGIHLHALRGRQVSTQDFHDFDYLLAMDERNLSGLHSLAPEGMEDRARLFLEFAPEKQLREVPDPYYGGPDGFEHVLDLVEAAAKGLLNHIREEQGL
ncbi:MAG: low molecular weight protein-tyrosine-phosphatase [Sphingomonadales bacterium]